MINRQSPYCVKIDSISRKKVGINGSVYDWYIADPNGREYIGRVVSRSPGTWDSTFRNPFKIADIVKLYNCNESIARDMSLRMFECYIRQHIDQNTDMLEHLKSLEGKQLGCWCNNSYECHGSILVKLFNEYCK